MNDSSPPSDSSLHLLMCDWISKFPSIGADILGLIRCLRAAVQDVFVCIWKKIKSRCVRHCGKVEAVQPPEPQMFPSEQRGQCVSVSPSVCGSDKPHHRCECWTAAQVLLGPFISLLLSWCHSSEVKLWKLLWPLDTRWNLGIPQQFSKTTSNQSKHLADQSDYKMTCL